MATQPTTNLSRTSDELRQQYAADGWEARLEAHHAEGRSLIESQPGTGSTIQKVMYKYWDADDNVVGVLFRYRRIDGENRLVVRMLRDGDTVYHGPIGIAPVR